MSKVFDFGDVGSIGLLLLLVQEDEELTEFCLVFLTCA